MVFTHETRVQLPDGEYFVIANRNHRISDIFIMRVVWGISSIGRVRALQARGTGIETRILHPFAHEQWQVGRVVKAVDSKSTGLRPRQFESGTCRLSVCRFSIVVIAPAL